VPESRSSGRYSHNESVPSPSADGGGGGATQGELRLRVLRSLPQTHLRYLFEEIRNLCRKYLRNKGVPTSELTSEELLSEIWQKLLGTVALDGDEQDKVTPALPSEWSVNPHVPEQDGRVVWLINEIGGSQALGHRYEDIQRQRFGRAVPGRGRPIVQPVNGEPFEVDQDWTEDRSLQEADCRLVWSGFLASATREFDSTEDVGKLIRLLAKFTNLFEDSSGSQWPVRKIVALLNEHFPPPDWRDRRVEDARRRLTNWINRLMRENALDATDLEALFARVARQLGRGNCTARVETRSVSLQS
jgi:hypothetical protein